MPPFSEGVKPDVTVMDKDRAAKILIANLRDQDASYESFVYNNDDYEPIAAVIVVQGEPATEVIVEACQEIVKGWENVKNS